MTLYLRLLVTSGCQRCGVCACPPTSNFRLGRHGNPAAGLEQSLLVVAGMLTVLTVLSCSTTSIGLTSYYLAYTLYWLGAVCHTHHGASNVMVQKIDQSTSKCEYVESRIISLRSLSFHAEANIAEATTVFCGFMSGGKRAAY